MDNDTVKSLKKALELIRKGRADKARPILVDLLKENPGVEEGWYLLSYTVGDPEKQIAALERALRINPDNDKAADRLKKAREKAEAQRAAMKAAAAEAEEAAFEAGSEAFVAEPREMAQAGEDEDFLSERLMVFSGSYELEGEAEEEPRRRSAPPFVESEAERKADYFGVQPQVAGPSGEKPRKPRRWLRVLILIALIGGISAAAWFYIGPQKIIEGVSGFFEAFQPGEVEETSTPAASNTPAPTPQGFKPLPPTWTPTPSLPPSNTSPPTETPTPADTPLPPVTPTPGTPES